MIQLVNVSGQLKWMLQGIFVAWTLCHRNTEFQYKRENLEDRGIYSGNLSVPKQGLVLLKNLFPDSCSMDIAVKRVS